MFNQTSEKAMHSVRWLLTIGWLVLILSFFWDPFSTSLTEPGHPWSPWSMDMSDCVLVQGECLPNLPQPMGSRIFWATIVPLAIIILLVLGHETWRRICPLSFLSQIPRALGIQRKQKTVNPRTGAISYQLAKVKENSWLQKNHLYFQLALFYVGLCMRILFVNSDRIFLGSFLLFTIASAILVGYLYAGKTWCHYLCPMAPVQMFYNGPRAQVLHVIFTLATFVGFNVFFLFGGRPQLGLLPMPLQLNFNWIIAFVSSLWVYVTLKRTSEKYSKESLAASLRRQLSKLTIDFSKFLGDRSLEELNTDEVYVLAKVLPNFSSDQGIQVYKGLLKESLEEGKVNSADSLEILRQVRLGLGIKDEEHFNILTELGIENPQLLDPTVIRSRENLIRLESYREALEVQLLDCIEKGLPLEETLNRKNQQIQSLRLEYGISDREENQILQEMFNGDSVILQTAENLLNQLSNLVAQKQVFDDYFKITNLDIIAFVRQVAILNKQKLITKKLLSIMELLGDHPNVVKIAKNTNSLASDTLLKIFQESSQEIDWQNRYSSQVWTLLSYNVADDPSPIAEFPTGLYLEPDDEETKNFLLDFLRDLITDFDPLIRSASLSGIHQIAPQEAETIARSLKDNLVREDWLLTEVANDILTPAHEEINTEETTTPLNIKFHSGGKVEEFTFTQSLIRIGSSSLNDLVVNGLGISPQHALVYIGEDDVNIIELGTAVGLTINGKVIKDNRYQLNQGDKIFFGSLNDSFLEIHWQNLTSSLQRTKITTLDKLLLLWNNSFFNAIDLNRLVQLAHNSNISNYPQGEVICQQDTISDKIFLLLAGSADVLITDIDNSPQRIKVSEIKIGEIIGEMGVITKQKRSAWVISTSDETKLLVIEASDFENVLRESQQLLRNLIAILSDRVRNLTNKLNE